MIPHAWFVEHQNAYVVRSLEPDEERAFTDHLGGCRECRAATERLSHELEWMGMGVRPATVRPGLVQRLTERATGRARPAARGCLAAALAASLAVAVGSGWWARRVVSEERRARVALASSLRAVRDSLALVRSATRVVHAPVSTGGDQGGLVLFEEGHSHRWTLLLYGLRPMPADVVVQLWFITDQGMIRGSTFPLHDRVPAVVTTGMPPGGAQVMGAALTLERAGAIPPAPTGQPLLRLML